MRGGRRRAWSVGQHLAAATAVIVVLLGAVSGYGAWQELARGKQAAIARAGSQAGTVAGTLGTGWATIGSEVSALASSPSARSALVDPSGCRLSFGTDAALQGHIDLLRADGRVVCSSAALPAGGVSQAGVAQLGARASTKGLVQWRPFRDSVTHQVALAESAAIFDPQGAVVGEVTAVIPLAKLADQMAKDFGGSEGFRYSLTGTAGVVLSAPGGTLLGVTNPIATSSYFYGSAPVPGTGWRLFAGIRPAVALGPTRSALEGEGILAGVALILILGLVEVIRRRIATPLQRLSSVIGDTGQHASAVLSTVSGTSEVVRLANTFQQVTEGRDAYEQQLTHQALHDPLTGLANRALLNDRLQHALDQARDGAEGVAVLVIDVDRFKLINDTLGHPAGDQVLVGLARRLSAQIGPADTLGRFGGDEFVVVRPRLHSPADASQLAELLAASAGSSLEVADQVIRPCVSIGIAIAEPSCDSERLLQDADTAMYHAKQAGGDRCEVFNPEWRQAGAERLALETELRVALERRELSLVYQPLIDLETSTIVGAESLLRWTHPGLGPIPPATFIPIAEQSGLIESIGLFALRSACEQALRWAADGYNMVVSVNLSARQLADPQLAEWIAATLTDTGCPPELIKLELTETFLMADANRAATALAAIKATGVKLSIDDFGTGYSSLSYLQRFPVDEIKIDRSFVDRLGDSRPNRDLVAAIIAMSDALGLHTVAEGVETPEEAAHLRRLGCQTAQGYLYARPVPGAALSEMMRRGRLLVGDRITAPVVQAHERHPRRRKAKPENAS